MRALLLLAILACGFAQACKNEVPNYRVTSTDGKVRSRAALVGKPTIFLFMKLGCPANPEAIPRFNRLATSLKGKVDVVGIINADLATAKKFAREMKITFPLLPDAKKTLIKGFGAKRSLEMTYSAPKSGLAKYPKVWDGYSRSMLQEVLDGIGHHGFKLPKIAIPYFPIEKRGGCMY